MLEWCKNCKHNHIKRKEKEFPCRDCKKRFGLSSYWEPKEESESKVAHPVMQTVTQQKPRAIYLGFSSHDCESVYKCPVCGTQFGSWGLCNQKKNENGTEKYCPKCKTELAGLD